MGELGRKFGDEQGAEGRQLAQASVEEVSRQMRDAGVPMDELGRKMGALGKDMERESMAADKVVRQLIREAQSKGLARPAPTGAGQSG
jgi:hypothetical protein